ncbi:hypothetical protein PUN28_004816 [Cardiocondyla obscurior]|uniref:Uncharacterized protein n=1 Tax=Cardiocondyla obscurior TaxID=286306 RepID=A0AAW2GGM7_9HYME
MRIVKHLHGRSNKRHETTAEGNGRTPWTVRVNWREAAVASSDRTRPTGAAVWRILLPAAKFSRRSLVHFPARAQKVTIWAIFDWSCKQDAGR